MNTIQHMDLSTLCTWIRMPKEAVIELQKSDSSMPGAAVLREHLTKAAESYETYMEMGISEQIYIDTMSAFSRFVREHMVSYGIYGFDRQWWTYRQTGMLLFRIGMLEYEMVKEEDHKVIHMHIPTGADLNPEVITDSIRQAKEFFTQYYPDYAAVPYECESWLLLPCLKEFLPETSRIIQFQSRFQLIKEVPDQPDYLEWLFQVGAKDQKDPDLASLPERTSLQRSMKAYVLAGNKPGIGWGRLM